MKFKLSTAVVVIGASLLGLSIPTSAAQLAGFTKNLPARASGSSLVQKTRYRRRWRGYHDDGGAVAAGAIIGLALGAIIASQAGRYDRSVAWCMRRYRSYDPRTHTWVDYHGRIRYCP